jgi:hypothetical protein
MILLGSTLIETTPYLGKRFQVKCASCKKSPKVPSPPWRGRVRERGKQLHPPPLPPPVKGGDFISESFTRALQFRRTIAQSGKIFTLKKQRGEPGKFYR